MLKLYSDQTPGIKMFVLRHPCDYAIVIDCACVCQVARRPSWSSACCSSASSWRCTSGASSAGHKRDAFHATCQTHPAVPPPLNSSSIKQLVNPPRPA